MRRVIWEPFQYIFWGNLTLRHAVRILHHSPQGGVRLERRDVLLYIEFGEALEESVFGPGGLEVVAHGLGVVGSKNVTTEPPLLRQVVLRLLLVKGDALGS
jgi:hypothetical protein